ncbi:AraC family transcriptional regulator ligand-binding domain-containing protein [Chitinophaga sp. GCM10012297]|uniref:AraC family transcriptional regulator ligand-binding domain-containing protein n=1 Tax=Chitinophaga chungangae TaxID=2821488 RepID=A0ABS3YBT5_9BACT|nr:AraC family transcriptional regulator [Chitinophaga chungangae]MBO9151614.1 AraC family transcriptional regulator ligand-binding domain-containing protein [Chitinophaga chungangae]
MGLQATVIREILHTAATYGEAYDALREKAGFTQEEISDSEQKVEWQKAASLYDLLADLTGNEQIGLAIGSEISISMTGMVGFMMQASRNLREALEVYCRYGFMVCPMITFVYREEGEKAIVELYQNAAWKNTYPRNARIAIDLTLASMVHHMQVLTGKQIRPLGAEVEFSKTAVSAYTHVLHCPVLFNAPLHRAVFSRQDMGTPVLTSDKSLYQLFNEILGQKKSLQLQASCRDSLKHLLLMQFKGQLPTIEDAALGLNITVRTLQRKLSDEQTSFREVANEVKKELALHLMKNPAVSITEVAGILGYNDLPAFRRAFKLWTNATPKTARQRLSASSLKAPASGQTPASAPYRAPITPSNTSPSVT